MTQAAKSGAQREEQRVTTHYDTRPPQLPLAKRIQIPMIVGAAVALQHTIGPTLRFEVLGWQHFEQIQAARRQFILAFWHRTIFLSTWWWRYRGLVAMTSANFDGQLIAGVLERTGCATVQGSSTRGGLRALAVLAQRIDQGRNAAFAIDGPRGPRYIAKPGPVLLARRTGCPILCYHVSAERGHTFEKTWDQFQIPYPFSRVVLVAGPPIEVPGDTDREGVERKHAEMQRLLERVRDTAESWFTLSPAEKDRQRALWNG